MGLLRLDPSCLPKPHVPLPCRQWLWGALGWGVPLVPRLGLLWRGAAVCTGVMEGTCTGD